MKRFPLLTWILLFFFAIGVFRIFMFRPSSVLVPLIVFGAIFYFFKNPEKLKFRQQNDNYKAPTAKSKNRSNKFTVIDGKFTDVKDDEPPKYH